MTKKRMYFYFIMILAALICGCGKNIQENNSSKEQKIPEIVFLNIVDFSQTADEDDIQYAMTFYDNKGNHYITEDSYVCSLDFDTLVLEYASGSLNDKIQFHTSCDSRELNENYEKLVKISEEETPEVIYSEYAPDVQSSVTEWYGLYYGDDGKIQSMILHVEDASGDHETNNEEANEIYQWLIGTFD